MSNLIALSIASGILAAMIVNAPRSKLFLHTIFQRFVSLSGKLAKSIETRPLTRQFTRPRGVARRKVTINRTVTTDLNDDGTTALDFNVAYNPPRSFNPYTTCPISVEGEPLPGQGPRRRARARCGGGRESRSPSFTGSLGERYVPRSPCQPL